MSDRYTCMVDGCGKKFATKRAKDCHRVEAHGKRRKTPNFKHYRSMAGSPRDDVYDFVDCLDLPDGAHWAMIEELSGLEPGDFA